MKKFSIAVLIFAGALLYQVSNASAQTPVFETFTGTGTVTSVIVSSAAIVTIDAAPRGSLNKTGIRRGTLELFNDDSANNLYCSFDISVSSVAPTTGTPSPHYGRRIAPRASWTVAVSYQIPIYCVADTGNAVCVLTQLGD